MVWFRSSHPLRRLARVGFEPEDFFSQALRRVVDLRSAPQFFLQRVDLRLLIADQVVCVGEPFGVCLCRICHVCSPYLLLAPLAIVDTHVCGRDTSATPDTADGARSLSATY